MTNVRMKQSKKLSLLGPVIIVTLGLVFGLFTLAGCENGKENEKEKEEKKELILRVTDVKLRILPSKTEKPVLHITAFGEVSSTGWTEPELILVENQCPKSFKCFEFRAQPPGGISSPVITPITVDYSLYEWEHIKMIKVIAKSNSITEPLPTENEAVETDDAESRTILTQYYQDVGDGEKDVPTVPEGYQLQVYNGQGGLSYYYFSSIARVRSAPLMGYHPYDWWAVNNQHQRQYIKVTGGKILVKIVKK
jgi:phenylpyruvate tautomerase PptA (4-oxalocrotonate tautomerase family)